MLTLATCSEGLSCDLSDPSHVLFVLSHDTFGFPTLQAEDELDRKRLKKFRIRCLRMYMSSWCFHHIPLSSMDG